MFYTVYTDFIITNHLAYILPAGMKILAFDFKEVLILIKQSKIHLQLNGWEGWCVQCTPLKLNVEKEII